MDVRALCSLSPCAILALILPCAGCALLQPAPSAQPEGSGSPAPAEPPQIVQATPTTQPAPVTTGADAEPPDQAESGIEKWAQQVARRDDLRIRAERAAGTDLQDKPVAQVDLDHPAPGRVAPASAGSQALAAALPAPEEGEGAPPPTEPVRPRVTVRPDKPVIPAARPPAAPQANSPQAAAGPATLADFIDAIAPAGEGADFRQQFDRRVLHAMSGEYERAREPLRLASAEQQRLAGAFIETLIAMRDAHGGQPDLESREILERMSGLREELERSSELSLPRLSVCRAVRGYGQYEEITPAVFLAGRETEFVAYCELRDFASTPLPDGQFESRFSLTLTLLTTAGDVALELKDDDIIDRCRAKRRDCFIPRLVRLPASLTPGEYVLKATVIDATRNQVAQQKASLRLVARS